MPNAVVSASSGYAGAGSVQPLIHYHLFTHTEDITVSKKPQATRVDDTPKKPLGQKIGRGTTKATMGAAFGLGRFAAVAPLAQAGGASRLVVG